MKLDLLTLHNSVEDKNLRQCLRAYTIISKYCHAPNEKNEKAAKIIAKLREINKRLKLKFGNNWKTEWEKEIGFKIKTSTFNEWLRGKASIPLVAIEKLKKFGLENEVQEISKEIEYVCTTTKEVARIPKELTPDILYLTGLILGDGCLPITHRKNDENLQYKFSLCSGDELFLKQQIKPMFEKIFEVKIFSLFYYNHGGPTWDLSKGSKPIYRFFTQLIGIPNGQKSQKACIPLIIKKLLVQQAVPFIAGLIDSDVGKHGKGMGCTFKSKLLVDDLILLLDKLGLQAKHYGTHFKNHKYIQHDFSIPKSQVKRLKELLEQNYLPKRQDRLETLFSLAGVPKRSNGLDSGVQNFKKFELNSSVA